MLIYISVYLSRELMHICSRLLLYLLMFCMRARATYLMSSQECNTPMSPSTVGFAALSVANSTGCPGDIASSA